MTDKIKFPKGTLVFIDGTARWLSEDTTLVDNNKALSRIASCTQGEPTNDDFDCSPSSPISKDREDLWKIRRNIERRERLLTNDQKIRIMEIAHESSTDPFTKYKEMVDLIAIYDPKEIKDEEG